MLAPPGASYDMTMQFGGTVLYVNQVSEVVDFYRRAFGLELRFFDWDSPNWRPEDPLWPLPPIRWARC